MFVFASGPDCVSLQITTGQPFVLRFPPGWSVDERGAPGCEGPPTGASVVAVRNAEGVVVASAGEVVRVAGEEVERLSETTAPVLAVIGLEPTDLAMSDAMALVFRDPQSFAEMRTRLSLPPCGLIVSNQFTTEPNLDDGYGSSVWDCVWDGFEAGTGAEYVTVRDTIDSGYLTRVVRLHPDGLVDMWTLLRDVENEPSEWTSERCDAVAPPDAGEPHGIELTGCRILESGAAN